MQRAIRFGHNNSWRFERGADHLYEFAFDHWTFDSQGFPLPRNLRSCRLPNGAFKFLICPPLVLKGRRIPAAIRD